MITFTSIPAKDKFTTIEYSYLLATFQAPIGILGALMGLVPVIGACIYFILLRLRFFKKKSESEPIKVNTAQMAIIQSLLG